MRTRVIFFCVIYGFAAASLVRAQDDPVLVVVNDVEIRQSAVTSKIGRAIPADRLVVRIKSMLPALIKVELTYQQAIASGVTEDPDFQRQLNVFKAQLARSEIATLAAAYRSSTSRFRRDQQALEDLNVRAIRYYEENLDEFIERDVLEAQNSIKRRLVRDGVMADQKKRFAALVKEVPVRVAGKQIPADIIVASITAVDQKTRDKMWEFIHDAAGLKIPVAGATSAADYMTKLTAVNLSIGGTTLAMADVYPITSGVQPQRVVSASIGVTKQIEVRMLAVKATLEGFEAPPRPSLDVERHLAMQMYHRANYQATTAKIKVADAEIDKYLEENKHRFAGKADTAAVRDDAKTTLRARQARALRAKQDAEIMAAANIQYIDKRFAPADE
jgi:hypothetical protein